METTIAQQQEGVFKNSAKQASEKIVTFLPWYSASSA